MLRLISVLVSAGCGNHGVPSGPDLGGGGGGGGNMVGPTHIPGNFTRLQNVTPDGWAIVFDAAQTAWAVKLADGSQQKIVDHAAYALRYGNSNLLFVSHDLGSDGNGPLAVWRAGSLTAVADSAPDIGQFSAPLQADATGQYVAYCAHAVGTRCDLIVDRVDHPAPHVLLGSVDLGSCRPGVRFSDGRLVVAHCTDATGTSFAVTSYAPDSGAGVDLLAPARRYFAAHDGVGVLVTTPADQTSLVPAAGGVARPLADNVYLARFVPDGSAALLTTTAHALERVAVADGRITVLQSSGARSLFDISPDGRFVTYYAQRDPNTSLNDLYLTGAIQPGAATTLNQATTSLGAEGFSDDSTWVLYEVDVDSNTFAAGSLRARPVAGGAERTLGAKVDYVWPAGGARLVFLDNWDGMDPGRADIEMIDLAHDSAPTKLATQAVADFVVTDDKHTIVWLQPNDGLYIRALP